MGEASHLAGHFQYVLHLVVQVVSVANLSGDCDPDFRVISISFLAINRVKPHRQSRHHEIGLLDVIEDQQGILMLGQIAAEVAGTFGLVFHMRDIIVGRQVARPKGELGQLVLPVE